MERIDPKSSKTVDLNAISRIYLERYRKNLRETLSGIDSSLITAEIQKIEEEKGNLKDAQFIELDDLERALKLVQSLKSLENWDEVLRRLADGQKSGNKSFDIYTILDIADARYNNAPRWSTEENLYTALVELSGLVDRLIIISNTPGDSKIDINAIVTQRRESMKDKGVDIS